MSKTKINYSPCNRLLELNKKEILYLKQVIKAVFITKYRNTFKIKNNLNEN